MEVPPYKGGIPIPPHPPPDKPKRPASGLKGLKGLLGSKEAAWVCLGLKGPISPKSKHLFNPLNPIFTYLILGVNRIEISTSATTWGRTRFVETLKDGATRTSLTADNIKVNSKKMADGNTYYARVKTAYEGLDGAAHTTEWGPVVKFVYRAQKPVIGDINGDGEVNASDATALINHLLGTESNPTNLCDVNGDGEVNSSDVTALINKILGN